MNYRSFLHGSVKRNEQTMTNEQAGTSRPVATPWANADMPVPYVQALRRASTWWRGIAATIAGLMAFAAILFVLILPVGGLLDLLFGNEPVDPAAPTVTAGYWLAGNLLLAALIPVSGLIQKLFYGVRPSFLSSVEGRFRWGWFKNVALVWVPISVVYMALLHLALPVGSFVFTNQTVLLMVIAVVTVPLQSAGEEYLFRGLVARAVGSSVAGGTVAVVLSTAVSAVLFMIVHGPPDLFAVGYYLAAGIGLSLAAHFSGGLEVGVLVHAINNTLLFIPIVLADKLTTLSVTTGPVLVVPTLIMLAFPFVVRWLARRHNVTTKAPPAVARRNLS